ncbi:succinyl-CoA synthetase beta subunit [Bradyrhizobium sp. OAE829]
MNIHEYQAKALLHEFGVPISRGVAVLKASDSEAAGQGASRPDLGCEKPDPRWRPRQG